MKVLSVLKKHFLLFSLLTATLVADEELSDVLSEDREALLGYQTEQVTEQSKQLEKAWINPIVMQYSKNYSTQFGETIGTGQFLVSVDQPIFKMGGIWAAIKYAKALGKANALDVEIQKRQLISQALTLLYNIKKSKLQVAKLDLTLKNDELNIAIEKERYEAGLTNRTLYDQALLKRNQDLTAKLDIEMNLVKLNNDFSLLSNHSPEPLTLPNFSMIDENRYTQGQLELQRDTLRIEEKRNNKYMTLTKYMPELSVTGRYTNEDLNPLFQFPGSRLRTSYYNYGFKVTMPLNVNMLHDIQISKIEYMNARITLDEKRKTVANNFKLSKKRLEIIDQKIALSKDDALHYESMLVTVQDLEALGEKSNLDTQIVSNTFEVRELDQEIYKIDAQLELLGLYINVADAL